MCAAVSVVAGPAEDLVHDAILVPVSARGEAAAHLRRFDAHDRPRLAATAAAIPAAGGMRVVDGLGAQTLAVVARLEPGTAATLESRVRAAVLQTATAIVGGAGRSRPRRLVIPCPSTLGWFGRFEQKAGTIALLEAARAAAELGVDIVLTIEDRAIMRSVQRERCARAQRWWPMLGAEAFDVLAGAARTACTGRAVFFAGSGVSSPDGSAGMDARMRSVAKCFGLSTVVERGVGEGRVLLEAALARADDDRTGVAMDRLASLIDAEFATKQHSLATAIMVSAPSGVLCAVAPDGALGFAADGVRGQVEVRELLGSYRDPASMAPASAARYGLPRLPELVADAVPAHPSIFGFIGLEPDPTSVGHLLEALEASVPGFSGVPSLFLEHVTLGPDGRRGSPSTPIVVTAAGARAAERARSFEAMLDAFVALLWASGEGSFAQPSAPPAERELPPVDAGSTSVWAMSAGLPGRRR